MRLRPSLFWRARAISPDLPLLLPACRDLSSARQELRWIREHAAGASATTASGPGRGPGLGPGPAVPQQAASPPPCDRITRLCRARGRGVPLQYVLGSQPFGPLDIRCRPGVLVPRQETEAWVYHLVETLRASSLPSAPPDRSQDAEPLPPLRVVDFCSGTGCISLLVSKLLAGRGSRGSMAGRGLEVRGFDIEPRAVALARANLAHNERLGVLKPQSWGTDSPCSVSFEEADIFATPPPVSRADIIVSNPPYISARGFDADTSRSVRNWEPKLALVPDSDRAFELARRGDSRSSSACLPQDIFYARLLDMARDLRARVLVLEVGDLAQARRVVRLALAHPGGVSRWRRVEIWRDWPDMEPEPEEAVVLEVDDDRSVPVKGSGHGRVVFLQHQDG